MLRFSLRDEAAVRAVMHQDGEAELARADQHDGDDVCERIGEDRDQRNRAEDHGPGMRDQRNAFPLDALAQMRKLRGREQLAGQNAADGHKAAADMASAR